MSEYISLAGLKAEGWTDGLVKKYLGEPDKTAPNPHYSRAGAPMRLYLHSRVAETMKGGQIQAALADAAAKRATRRSAAQRSVNTKVRRAETAMRRSIGGQLEQVLSSWTWPRLVREACASYNRGDGIPDWAYGKRDWADNRSGNASPDSAPEFLLRICCNFVRHQLLSYEHMLGGYVGTGAARDVAHDAVSKAVRALLDLTPEEEREREERTRMEEEQRKAERQAEAERQQAEAARHEARQKERTDQVAKLIPWASHRQQQIIAARYECATLEQCLAAAKALGFDGDKKRWAGRFS
jgi:hypothetical protein